MERTMTLQPYYVRFSTDVTNRAQR